jgi:hypothetical protein
MFCETFLSMSSTSVSFYNTANVEFLGFPAVQLKPRFFWDMAQCLWVIGAQNFETTDGDYERLSEVFELVETI